MTAEDGETAAVVYRVYDANDRLIYIGATTNLDQRMAAHRAHSWWYSLVAQVDTEPYLTVPEAFADERLAIRTERPAFNHRGCGGRRDLTDDEIRLCQTWIQAKRSRGAGSLPVCMRWVARVELAPAA